MLEARVLASRTPSADHGWSGAFACKAIGAAQALRRMSDAQPDRQHRVHDVQDEIRTKAAKAQGRSRRYCAGGVVRVAGAVTPVATATAGSPGPSGTAAPMMEATRVFGRAGSPHPMQAAAALAAQIANATARAT